MNLARNSDPDTSHAAAMQQRNLVRERQRILDAFQRLGPMTDSELEDVATREAWPHAGDTYYRRRRSDLKALGALTSTNERRANAQGNTETVWQLGHREGNGNMGNSQQRIVFTKLDDDTWGIVGRGLITGEEVTVTAKSGEESPVIVGEILNETDGHCVARFERIETDPTADGHIVFRKVDQQWLVQGKDLVPGEYVTVTKKDGSTVEVFIREIINQTDDFNLALWSDRDEMPDVN